MNAGFLGVVIGMILGAVIGVMIAVLILEEDRKEK